jgi:hypothetical protein
VNRSHKLLVHERFGNLKIWRSETKSFWKAPTPHNRGCKINGLTGVRPEAFLKRG